MPGIEGKIRYAVVGGGWISQAAFMPGVGQTSNSLMTAIVTGDRTKGEALAKDYGLTVYGYDEYDAMLMSGTVDAVYIATPNFRHREFAEPALKAGIHVLLEKPMEVSVEDAEAIEAAAKASGAKLMIAYRLHCEPGTIAMVEAVRNGEIGTPRFFTSAFCQTIKATNHRATSGYWAGPVPDMGAYPINAVRNLFEAEPIEVMAVASRTERDLGCDDTVSVILKFTGARQASFTLSYSSGSVDQFHLVGSKGAMEVSPAFGFGEGTAITYRLTKDGETTEHTAPVVDQFGGETEYFSDCILNDREPEPNGEEGVLDMIVIAAIERAIETGTPQKLQPRSRQRRIGRDQARTLDLATSPDLVDIEVPIG
ncbi:Gfo/Idh/MocA family oxidoreductase [Jiella sp. MQZ9-1]|uniref:Gfo/Idh/MocA family oxidoreductase n=1 Tax=Jiella flava TaxID=2816857 RepID=A0A939FWD9_9HYPH|nr:Gfo/Idh/MocA family oxidoreductase [Jiella flava]MBO0662700.1 Gfo/Idh/MocA family oxidoreductase [Jiella flava]MCD2471122.1 Gfo/Idh/MocA family oxidoreductase [Jiella flava]